MEIKNPTRPEQGERQQWPSLRGQVTACRRYGHVRKRQGWGHSAKTRFCRLIPKQRTSKKRQRAWGYSVNVTLSRHFPGNERETERKGNPECSDKTKLARWHVQLWFGTGHLQRKCSHGAGIRSVRKVKMCDDPVMKSTDISLLFTF